MSRTLGAGVTKAMMHVALPSRAREQESVACNKLRASELASDVRFPVGERQLCARLDGLRRVDSTVEGPLSAALQSGRSGRVLLVDRSGQFDSF